MKKIGVTLRVDTFQYPSDVERRDGCDQRWFEFFKTCDLVPILLPNNLLTVKHIIDSTHLDGYLLTGGNSPVACGGEAPERDCVDDFLIQNAIHRKIPLLGVCRGAQSIQLHFKQIIHPVSGHVNPSMDIKVNGAIRLVNSFHNLGSTSISLPLRCWAKSFDSVIKAISHDTDNIHGIMWHPERIFPFNDEDIRFFKEVFAS